MKLGVVLFTNIVRWSVLRTKGPIVCQRSFQSKSRKRTIGVKDLNSALKPFFFMVHPDLFGNFPKKRNVNEDSLKKLNSYLQTLVAKRRVQHNENLSLKFFVRDSNQPELNLITEISVNLCGTSPLNEVDKILKSAGLPGLLSDREGDSKPRQGKTIQHNVMEPKETLCTFLEQKAPLARMRLTSTYQLRKQVVVLNEKICRDFGFESLSVECSWRVLLIHGLLKNLYALLTRHKNEVEKASGWSVVLGSWGGIDAEGVIHLNIEDEPLAWIRLLSSVDKYSMMLLNVKNLKCAISQMLGGLTIINAEYCKLHLHLHKFRASLKDLYLNLNSTAGSNNGNLHFDEHKGIISSCVTRASVLPSGLFLIPLSMDGFDIISFLTTSVAQARKAKEIYEKKLLKEKEITDLCVDRLELQSLTRNTSINHLEMTSCCENLVNLSNAITKGLMVKVAHAYHMSADGELTIPWNWKERAR